MNEIVLSIRDLTLKYRMIQSSTLKKELLSFKRRAKKDNEFSALKGISFDVYHGDVVGIIGSNGAGKSTLLRVIANVYQPDSGTVVNYAESTSLLSIGTGFINELSGIENIYLSGLLQGLTKKKIDDRIEDIVLFSGIGSSVYQPIRTYSTGMRARLAFSISSHIDPDILLIDELLGVGDKEFKEKSSARIREMIESDRTVLLVSHSINTIKSMCNKVLWIDHGELIAYGNTEEVTEKYNGR